MTKPIGAALLVVGIVLLVMGFNESHSFASDVSRAFTNSPTDRSLWMLVGGGVSSVLGIFFIMSRA